MKLVSITVEVTDAEHNIAVRYSKDALGRVLLFRQHAWRQFAAKVKTERLRLVLMGWSSWGCCRCLR